MDVAARPPDFIYVSDAYHTTIVIDSEIPYGALQTTLATRVDKGLP